MSAARLCSHVVGDDVPVALVDRPEMQAALNAATGAQMLATFAALTDFRRVIESVAATGDLDPERGADILWAIGSPEVCQQLTGDRGRSDDDYQQ